MSSNENQTSRVPSSESKATPEFCAAFATLKAGLQTDPEYAWGWQCNIAMCAVDEGVDPIVANNIAARFMKLCFDVDIKQSTQWESLGGGSVLSAKEIG